jgi:hypothetical protein
MRRVVKEPYGVEGSRDELVRRGMTLKDLRVDAVMPRGVRAREDLAFFRKEVPGVPLLVIAGADDSSVQEYADLNRSIEDWHSEVLL